jgi:hypothetical protein
MHAFFKGLDAQQRELRLSVTFFGKGTEELMQDVLLLDPIGVHVF